MIVAAYTFYLVLTTSKTDLAESYLGFYLFPADLLGLLGIIVGMLAGELRPARDSQTRRRRLVAALVGIGSFALSMLVLT